MKFPFLSLALVCLLGAFTHSTQAAELPVPDNVIFERDIEYTRPNGVPVMLNLARPKNITSPRPVVICIHGGGFRAGTREGYNKTILKLAQNGFVAATISYRLAPTNKFPAAVHDTKAAVRWMRANAAKYQVDPERIGVMGGSAGGHLVQFLGVTAGVPEFEGEGNLGYSSAVTCVVNYYGPSDFTQSYGKSVDAHEVLPLWFGGNLEQERFKHILGSPLNWVNPRSAPTLLIHGTEDKYVAYEQAIWMRDRLKACGVPVELLTLEGAGHGFKGEYAEKAEAAMLAYFAKQLKP
jgi:acetyl esterase/lipase